MPSNRASRDSRKRPVIYLRLHYLLEIGTGTEPDEVVISAPYGGEKGWVRRSGLDKDMGGIDDLDFLDCLFHIGQSGCPFERGSILPHKK
jgi:hypothetical protein